LSFSIVVVEDFLVAHHSSPVTACVILRLVLAAASLGSCLCLFKAGALVFFADEAGADQTEGGDSNQNTGATTFR
jgi:hypothetical protein